MDTPQTVNTSASVPLEHLQTANNRQNADNQATTTTALEKDLLNSLLAIMQPFIVAHIALAQGGAHNVSEAGIYRETILNKVPEVANGPEGKTFVRALKDFIGANVHAVSQPDRVNDDDRKSQGIQVNQNTQTDTAPVTYVDQFTGLNAPTNMGQTISPTLVVAIPEGVSPTELEMMTLKLTRAHVFNNMPIRLLEFDDNGSNLKLIGRDEIFSRILPRVQLWTNKPEFQRNWIEALDLRDVDITLRPRHDKMNTLITEAIGRGAHYAILSHTWIRGSPGDVVFNDWETCASNPRGYAKISKFCGVAARDHGMKLGWLDTICINKDSSSELDESIRSMYRWYQVAHVCITYLSETERLNDGTHDSWFTRGWTLQELLSPKHSVFYNKHWRRLGSSKDDNIQSFIEDETTITKQELELCGQGRTDDIPLSRRMQMASNRQVTREEDSSYSLLGLLGVDISVAYGEGAARAFHRLFRELLATKKHVLDLFNRTYFYGDSHVPSSITRYSQRAVGFDYSDWGTHLDDHLLSEPISVTHLGVRIQCLLIPSLCAESDEDPEYYKPKGQFSLRIKSSIRSKPGRSKPLSYNMLDSRLYLPTLPKFPIMDVLPVEDTLKTFAVLNLEVKKDNVILPEFCMGIGIYTPDRPGTVGPFSKITHLPATRPYCFSLTTTRSAKSIPIDELESHGMQLVTLYL